MAPLTTSYRYVVETTHGYSVELERKNKMRAEPETIAARMAVSMKDVTRILLVDGDGGETRLYACAAIVAAEEREQAARREMEQRDFAYWDREYASDSLAKHVRDQIDTARHFIADLERDLERFDHWDAAQHDAAPDYEVSRFAADCGNELAEALVGFIENIARNSQARYGVSDSRRYVNAVERWHEQMKFYAQALPSDDQLPAHPEYVHDVHLTARATHRDFGLLRPLPDDGQGTDEHLPRYVGPDTPHIPCNYYYWPERGHFRPSSFAY